MTASIFFWAMTSLSVIAVLAWIGCYFSTYRNSGHWLIEEAAPALAIVCPIVIVIAHLVAAARLLS